MLYSYKKLSVYSKVQDWILDVYTLIKFFPKEEQFALCDQLRRSSVSVASNIAEGSSRSSNKEFSHFIEISYGSLMEAICQLELAQLLGYIKIEDLEKIQLKTSEIAKMLSGLKKSLISRT